MKINATVLSAILSLSFSGVSFLAIPATAAQFEGSILEWKKQNENFKKPEESFQKALKLLKENYADKNVTEEDLYLAATQGMLAALNSGKENWNTVLNERAMEDTKIMMTSTVVGIGATLDFDEKTKNSKINAILPDSAAQKAGLKEFDQILRVNGKRFNNLATMVAEIRGKAGEKVRLKVLREDQILDFTIARSAVKLPMFDQAKIDDKTFYLSLEGFSESAVPEFKKALERIGASKPEKLILDLRDNSGGLFEKGLEVAESFLSKGDVIVQTKSRDGVIKNFNAKGTPWSPTTKLIVLVSEETASSAEMLATSLKENRKAVVLGRKTAGKWSVESVESLPNGYHIKYSVMWMLSPSGKALNGIGLAPDIETALQTEAVGIPISKNLKLWLEKDSTLRAAVELPVVARN